MSTGTRELVCIGTFELNSWWLWQAVYDLNGRSTPVSASRHGRESWFGNESDPGVLNALSLCLKCSQSVFGRILCAVQRRTPQTRGVLAGLCRYMSCQRH